MSSVHHLIHRCVLQRLLRLLLHERSLRQGRRDIYPRAQFSRARVSPHDRVEANGQSSTPSYTSHSTTLLPFFSLNTLSSLLLVCPLFPFSACLPGLLTLHDARTESRHAHLPGSAQRKLCSYTTSISFAPTPSGILSQFRLLKQDPHRTSCRHPNPNQETTTTLRWPVLP
jgi:hypothetical protein